MGQFQGKSRPHAFRSARHFRRCHACSIRVDVTSRRTRPLLPARQGLGLSGQLSVRHLWPMHGLRIRHQRLLRHQSAVRLCATGALETLSISSLRRVMTTRRLNAVARIDRIIAGVPPACRRDAVLLAGQVLFVAGWSAMWASCLQLIARIPISICLVLMVIGLSLPRVVLCGLGMAFTVAFPIAWPPGAGRR